MGCYSHQSFSMPVVISFFPTAFTINISCSMQTFSSFYSVLTLSRTSHPSSCNAHGRRQITPSLSPSDLSLQVFFPPSHHLCSKFWPSCILNADIFLSSLFCIHYWLSPFTQRLVKSFQHSFPCPTSTHLRLFSALPSLHDFNEIFSLILLRAFFESNPTGLFYGLCLTWFVFSILSY